MTGDDILAADMARLGARPYSEVGVPMFVIAQDLASIEPPRDAIRTNDDLAERFAALMAAVVAENPEPQVADVARLVEVFADRHLLSADGQRFTLIFDSKADAGLGSLSHRQYSK